MRQSVIEVFFLAALDAWAKGGLDSKRLNSLIAVLSGIRLDEFSVDCLTEAHGILRQHSARKQVARADADLEWKRLADRISVVVIRMNTPRGER